MALRLSSPTSNATLDARYLFDSTRHNPTAPNAVHPVEDITIAIGNDDVDAVVVAAAQGRKPPRDCDAAFAVDETGRISPVCVGRVGQLVLSGALQGRLGVQPAQEYLQRQSRAIEVLLEQVQVQERKQARPKRPRGQEMWETCGKPPV